MTTNDPASFDPNPSRKDETIAAFAEYLDAVDKTIETNITDDQIKARLRRLTQNAKQAGTSPQTNPQEVPPPKTDRQFGRMDCFASPSWGIGRVDKNIVADSVDFAEYLHAGATERGKTLSTWLLPEWRRADQIILAARRDADRLRDAALNKAARIETEARRQAEQILEEARNEAARIRATAPADATQPTANVLHESTKSAITGNLSIRPRVNVRPGSAGI
jgi:vacuolar-type H+-ATPase subunit H